MIANGDDPYLQSVVPGTNGGMLTVASLDMRKRVSVGLELCYYLSVRNRSGQCRKRSLRDWLFQSRVVLIDKCACRECGLSDS